MQLTRILSRPEFARDALGQADDRCFRSRVIEHIRHAEGGDRRLVDDRTATPRAHVRQHRLDAQPSALDVDRHRLVPAFNRQFGQRPAFEARKHRSIIHEDVDAAELSDRPVCHCLGRCRVRDIDSLKNHLPAGGAKSCRSFLALCLKHVSDQHRRPLLHQCFSIGTADASRTAGDDGDFPCQRTRHWSVISIAMTIPDFDRSKVGVNGRILVSMSLRTAARSSVSIS